MGLEIYRRKRNFTKTAEPSGEGKREGRANSGAPLFVVQEHHASHLHYDFRLEAEGVLKSWAIPKGPSLEIGVRRLAVEVEDHPLGYEKFEGTIPKGEYGGGHVAIWDHGTYGLNGAEKFRDALAHGKLDLEMHGEKLHGRFTLVRASHLRSSKPSWFLIKRPDGAGTGVSAARPSSKSGRKGAESPTQFREPGSSDSAVRTANPRPPGASRKSVGSSKSGAPGKSASPSNIAASGKSAPTASDGAADELNLKVEGRVVHLTRLSKIFYPHTGFSKKNVLNYYRKVAPALLAHLHGKPVTLKRYPDGVEGEFFYEKRRPAHAPSWLGSVPMRGIDFCRIDDLSSLLWVVNAGSLELHPYLSTADDLDRPRALVFDLDPGEGTGLAECREVALRLRRVLAVLGLEAYPKTSGSKGMQIYAPLNSKGVNFRMTNDLAHRLALFMERALPSLVVSRMAKPLRNGKVLIDWSQNHEAKTTVSVYSLRAGQEPHVSTPLTWRELEAANTPAKIARLRFSPEAALKRLETLGDLFSPVLEQVQCLPDLTALARVLK